MASQAKSLVPERDRWLAQDDAHLLAECHVDTYRASGPGGQKRNKTSSAVRLRHVPSGIMTIAEESRSQHENKARALRRLRLLIALEKRIPLGDRWQRPPVISKYQSPSGSLKISARNPELPAFVAVLLDVLASANGVVGEAAQRIGVTTAQFSKTLAAEPKLFEAANQIRRQHGLRPLEK